MTKNEHRTLAKWQCEINENSGQLRITDSACSQCKQQKQQHQRQRKNCVHGKQAKGNNGHDKVNRG